MIPASIRNKNPGAQEPGPSSRKFGATSHEVLRWTYKGKPATNKIATFPTDQHGAAAMFDLLERKYTGKTVENAISTWCGSYYAGAYTAALEANGGVKKTDVLTKQLVRDPAFAVPLCVAMARVEAGRDYPMSHEQWHAAHAMAFGTAVAPEFAADNDVPSPGPNARRVAEIKDAAVKAAVPVVVTGGGVATVAMPTPPTAILDHAVAWKSFGTTVTEMMTWAIASPKALAIVGVAGAVMVLGPRVAPSWFGRS